MFKSFGEGAMGNFQEDVLQNTHETKKTKEELLQSAFGEVNNAFSKVKERI